MYNDIILRWLSAITPQDYLSGKVAQGGQICIAAGAEMNQIIITIIKKQVYFSVVGSPYLMAMTKWLQQMLIKDDITGLKQQTVLTLARQFDLPAYKRQDALLILSLIEQINAA